MKLNNFDSYITRDQYRYFKECTPWSGDFQQNAHKVDFILKSGHRDIFAQNLIL